MAGLLNLSDREKAAVKEFAQTDYKKRAIAEAMAKAQEPSNFERSLFGQGDFRDSGRPSSGPGEAMDSLVGVPVRTWANETARDGASLGGLLKAARSVGTDPRQAPTGVDVADNMGIENPYAGAAMATAVDMASLPVPGAMLPGVAGRVVDKADDAKKLLAGIETAEQAAKLTGAERQAYLEALDAVYGDRAKRAADMGFSDNVYYHGTTVDIPEFKHDAKGLSTGAQSAKKGFFFASDPSTASDYADLAREKGVIREGDKVTTRALSDTADLLDDTYNRQKLEHFQAEQASAAARRAEEEMHNAWKVKLKREAELESGDWEKIGIDRQEYVEDIRRLAERIESKKTFVEQMKKKAAGHWNQFAALKDSVESVGQNVLPVRLSTGKGKAHVKDYKGQGYRDTTYAEEMAKAQEKGNTGVLFKNTYDPADPSNRVKQDIAAVFEPNQIRSTNAAFDPRFADSPLLLAGHAGAAPAGPVAGLLSAQERQADLEREAVKRKRKKGKD